MAAPIIEWDCKYTTVKLSDIKDGELFCLTSNLTNIYLMRRDHWGYIVTRFVPDISMGSINFINDGVDCYLVDGDITVKIRGIK